MKASDYGAICFFIGSVWGLTSAQILNRPLVITAVSFSLMFALCTLAKRAVKS